MLRIKLVYVALLPGVQFLFKQLNIIVDYFIYLIRTKLAKPITIDNPLKENE